MQAAGFRLRGRRWPALVVLAVCAGLRRWERMFAAIPGFWPGRSLNRCGPPSSASTTSGVHRSPTLASARQAGRAVLLFSHERILAPGVDSRTVVSSNLQVTSYWRHSSDDNP